MLHADAGRGHPLTLSLRGAREVAGRAVTFGHLYPYARPALVNGAAGVVVATAERVLSVMAFPVHDVHIVAIQVLLDPDRLKSIW